MKFKSSVESCRSPSVVKTEGHWGKNVLVPELWLPCMMRSSRTSFSQQKLLESALESSWMGSRSSRFDIQQTRNFNSFPKGSLGQSTTDECGAQDGHVLASLQTFDWQRGRVRVPGPAFLRKIRWNGRIYRINLVFVVCYVEKWSLLKYLFII